MRDYLGDGWWWSFRDDRLKFLRKRLTRAKKDPIICRLRRYELMIMEIHTPYYRTDVHKIPVSQSPDIGIPHSTWRLIDVERRKWKTKNEIENWTCFLWLWGTLRVGFFFTTKRSYSTRWTEITAFLSYKTSFLFRYDYLEKENCNVQVNILSGVHFPNSFDLFQVLRGIKFKFLVPPIANDDTPFTMPVSSWAPICWSFWTTCL